MDTMVIGLSMLQGGLMYNRFFKEAKFAIDNVLDRFSIHVGTNEDGSAKFLKLNTTKFNDGSIKVQLDGFSETGVFYNNLARISCYLGSMDDVMVLGQIIETLKRRQIKSRVALKTTLYTRYDRVMHEDGSDSFGLKVFANVLNSFDVFAWILDNPHSNVFGELLSDFSACTSRLSWDYKPNEILKYLEDILGLSIDSKSYSFVIPDKGAKSRFNLVVPEYVCDKSRDKETGKIMGITAEQNPLPWICNRSDRLLIIDDICENGGTFIGCVDAIRKLDDFRPVDLYVDYGVFPENTDFTKLAHTIDRLIIGNIEKKNLENLMKYFKGDKRIFVNSVY